MGDDDVEDSGGKRTNRGLGLNKELLRRTIDAALDNKRTGP